MFQGRHVVVTTVICKSESICSDTQRACDGLHLCFLLHTNETHYSGRKKLTQYLNQVRTHYNPLESQCQHYYISETLLTSIAFRLNVQVLYITAYTTDTVSVFKPMEPASGWRPLRLRSARTIPFSSFTSLTLTGSPLPTTVPAVFTLLSHQANSCPLVRTIVIRHRTA